MVLDKLTSLVNQLIIFLSILKIVFYNVKMLFQTGSSILDYLILKYGIGWVNYDHVHQLSAAYLYQSLEIFHCFM